MLVWVLFLILQYLHLCYSTYHFPFSLLVFVFIYYFVLWLWLYYSWSYPNGNLTAIDLRSKVDISLKHLSIGVGQSLECLHHKEGYQLSKCLLWKLSLDPNRDRLRLHRQVCPLSQFMVRSLCLDLLLCESLKLQPLVCSNLFLLLERCSLLKLSQWLLPVMLWRLRCGMPPEK